MKKTWLNQMIRIVDKDKMILKGVYKASCSLIRTDRQLSN